MLPTAFGLAWTSPRRVRWSAEELLRLLSLAFGRTGAIPIPWAPSHPLYLKTSPPLGARHPIEAYVAPLDTPGLRPGWYHVCAADERLDMISEAGPGDVEELQRLFPTFAEPVRAIIVLTAYFDRSMFRYREPQTFRSLHLDSGTSLCLGDGPGGRNGNGSGTRFRRERAGVREANRRSLFARRDHGSDRDILMQAEAFVHIALPESLEGDVWLARRRSITQL